MRSRSVGPGSTESCREDAHVQARGTVRRARSRSASRARRDRAGDGAHLPVLPEAVRRAAARAGRDRSGAARGRDPGPARPLGIGQVHAAAYRGRPARTDLRLGALSRQAPGGTNRGHRRGVPDLRAVSVVDRDRERRARPGCARPGGSRRARAGARRDRADRPGRFRVGVSARAVGRHAPAGRLRARAGGRPVPAVDGRAVFRTRRADRRNAVHRFPRSVGVTPVADPGGDDGDPQYRGGGPDVRSRHGARSRSGTHRGDAGDCAATSAQSARSRLPGDRRSHLRDADRAHRRSRAGRRSLAAGLGAGAAGGHQPPSRGLRRNPGGPPPTTGMPSSA